MFEEKVTLCKVVFKDCKITRWQLAKFFSLLEATNDTLELDTLTCKYVLSVVSGAVLTCYVKSSKFMV